MNKTALRAGLAMIASVSLSAAANAAPIGPTFQTFGDLQNATSTSVTFSGSGIPTNPAAYSVFTAGNGDELVLGLIATPRFSNPTPTNDGAGTYTATAGLNGGRATWNFSYFAEIIDNGGGSTFADFNTVLLYDLDPGVDTDEADLGVIDFGASPGVNPIQDSQNATFGFLASGIPGLVTPPSFTPFNANVGGEYTFAFRSTLGDVAINVNVVPTPEPAALALIGAGVLALGATRIRRRSANATAA